MKTIHAIRGKRVVTPQGVKPATVHIRNGTITAVRAYDELPPRANVYDAGESVVMPGLVDTHVHINEPGRTDWEGFETATRAAAAGGVTTLIDMPLNSIPATTTVAALEAKRAAARKKCWVNVGFWGGVVPGNAGELRAMYRAGVFGFKCFLVPSGVPEFEQVNESDLRAAFQTLAAMGAPLLVHAELPGPIEEATKNLAKADPGKYKTWLRSRPPAAETKAIEMLVRLARDFKARVHIVHLSSELSLPLIRRAKKEGLRITAETCPHYLFFASGSIQNGRTEYKCAPPIRDARNNGKFLGALGNDTIDFVVSDHSPSPPSMKCMDTGNFFQAWGGISSLQLGLAAMWTKLSSRKYSFAHLVRWMCSGPAHLAGLETHRGAIAVGYDADIVIWNPEKRFIVRPEMLHHRHKVTPYLNESLRGVVEATFLRGQMIYNRGRFLGIPPGTPAATRSTLMDFTDYIDLAAERLGGRVLAANDEFFAPKENLLIAAAPVWIADKYTDVGKWVDGWETRRRRSPGYDWCIVKLGLPGAVHGVIVDTAHFKGNFPERCELERCVADGDPSAKQLKDATTSWSTLLPKSPLWGDTQNRFAISSANRTTHLRLKIYPDGGVARLRVHGEVIPDWPAIKRAGGEIDLAAIEHGGLVIDSSDMFFGSRNNLILPGPSTGMHDGWETRRRRGPGHDWCVVRLGALGTVRRLEVDTSYFKGNFPESCSLEVCHAAHGVTISSALADLAWKEILPRTKLKADSLHVYEKEILDAAEATHARFHIYPDGGVARLRIFGTLARRNAQR